MAVINTGSFTLPEEIYGSVYKKVQTESVLAKLSKSAPQKFGTSNVVVLTGTPKAELVGESGKKGETPAEFTTKAVVPHKVQVTMRVSDEVKWADEDYQMGVLDELADQAGIALGRALDLMGIHKINPATGAVASQITEGICDTTHTVSIAAAGNVEDAILEAASDVIANGYAPDGIALDPAASFALATMKDADGRRIYPELGLGQTATAFMGLNFANGDTVSGKNEISGAANIEGIVGDFDAFKYGVQREIKVKVIEFGDPDQTGRDLQAHNEIALRAEIVYAFGVMDEDAFAVITK